MRSRFDEKWSFVGKKQKTCDPADPADAEQGNNWDHVAFDPEHRLVVSVVPGKRTAEKVEQLVQDFQQRTGSRPMNLMTSDEYPAYKKAILKVYGEEVRPPRTGKAGRPKAAYKVPPPDLRYATVHKTRKKGRVVKVSIKVIFGAIVVVMAALAQSLVSKAINTSFVERQHGSGPQSECQEGTPQLLLLEEVGGARGGDLLDDVQLQLLLGGADATRER